MIDKTELATEAALAFLDFWTAEADESIRDNEQACRDGCSSFVAGVQWAVQKIAASRSDSNA